MRNLTIIIVSSILLFSVTILLKLTIFPPQQTVEAITENTEEANDLALAQSLLKENKPREALQVIKKYERPNMVSTEEGKKWFYKLIQVYSELNDSAKLLFLYEQFPTLFEFQEKASILIAERYLAMNNLLEFKKIRESWRGREKYDTDWFYIDVDALVARGQQTEAKRLLESKKYQGSEDTGRLTRLALLYLNQDPKIALRWLNQAEAKEPNNYQILLLKAHVLESIGQTASAQYSLVRAIELEPTNSDLFNELAEFYRRQGKISLAMQMWQESYKIDPKNQTLISLYFWNRVVSKTPIPWKKIKLEKDPLQGFTSYLFHLPNDFFWDNVAFDKLNDTQVILSTQQSSFWLKLIQLLLGSNESAARTLLKGNPFTDLSWDPLLEKTLMYVLEFRNKGSYPEEPFIQIAPLLSLRDEDLLKTTLGNRHSLFKELYTYSQENITNDDEYKDNAEKLKNLLLGQNGFSAVFLAAGWLQTALALCNFQESTVGYSSWYPFGIAQALRSQGLLDKALQYANAQRRTPEMALVIAEILYDHNNKQEGIASLKELAQLDSQVGYRASFLLAENAISLRNYDEACSYITQQPLLLQSVEGKEQLARIALLEGNIDLAKRLYTTIVDQSYEAKSFLANLAFENKNWDVAEKLTKEALQVYPTNQVLQANLKIILEEKQKETSQDVKGKSNAP